ncbi:MAG: DNA polymerase III subunit alpha [Chlorobiaceae bacterium]|nr:DNA polymerase III subunit alpha [Chlorobiaceae bacterium]
MSKYIHLHNHTHYSLQDGACTVEGLINAAKENGMHAVALTDHGVLYGVPEFYKEAKKNGIKPIVGMEAYFVVDGTRFDRAKEEDPYTKKKKRNYHHLILLAKNFVGYKNLMKLSTLGFEEGFYSKPRIDFDLIQKYSEGLICTTACLGGLVGPFLSANNYDKAKSISKQFKDIFGDDFYLEIQDHHTVSYQPLLEGIPKLAKELDLKIVATNDCHYIKKEHAVAHNVFIHLSPKRESLNYKELRYKTDQIYFKSQAEMIKIFGKYHNSIENTLEIDSKIDLNLDSKENHFPNFPIPDDSTAKNLDDFFDLLSREKFNEKFPTPSQKYVDRFEYELKTIKEMGFSGYFLVVQDFINAAKEKNIPVGPGRGSVAGSLVAFILSITTIDPIKYSLLFERFLNPSRKSLPDIDVDFADDQRGEVIKYVRDKYGEQNVKQIITFNTLASKAVIRGVSRVLNIPIPTVNEITKHIPSQFGKVYSIDKALKEVPELKTLHNSKDPKINEMLVYSRIIEGMISYSGKHAAGVVITPKAVSEYIPLSKATAEEEIITQFSKDDLETFGILKMDFLGLRTLSIIRDAIKLIREIHNKEIDIEKIPLDDEKTYNLFGRGQTTGIFQFESPPMREYLKKLKPTSILDLAAMNALYRPGPMDSIKDFIDRKYGYKKIEYLHPVLEESLKETYGIIVYQEQVIQIASSVAGMSLAEADNLRKAMGKKDVATMNEQKINFISGAVKNNIPEKKATEIFELMEKFANYGFNKSHAVAYSVLGYQTAYLKVHYTAEYMASSLTHEFESKEKIASLLEDCRKSKVQVLPPSINNPSINFTVENKKIRFGLSAIKNVGVGAVEEIKKKRNLLQRNFTSLSDFCSNVDTRLVNKRVIEGLIFSGAFDSINKNRLSLLSSVEEALNFGAKLNSFKQKNMENIFGVETEGVTFDEPPLTIKEDWSDSEKLAKEREVSGFYLTAHPLKKYELEYNSFATIKLGEIGEDYKIEKVYAVGVINDLKTKIDIRGRTMGIFSLNDLSGFCECIMFATAYEKYKEHVLEENPVMIVAKPESVGDGVKLHVEEVIPINSLREKYAKYFKIFIEKQNSTPEIIKEIKSVLLKHPGHLSVIIQYVQENNGAKFFELDKIKIKITQAFVKDISKIVGIESIKLASNI